MVGLAFGQIAVHEVEIAAERSVEEGRPVRRRLAAADERRQGSASEFAYQPADGGDRLSIERADGDTNRVEHADLELPESLVAQIPKPSALDELRKQLNLGHDEA